MGCAHLSSIVIGPEIGGPLRSVSLSFFLSFFLSLSLFSLILEESKRTWRVGGEREREIERLSEREIDRVMKSSRKTKANNVATEDSQLTKFWVDIIWSHPPEGNMTIYQEHPSTGTFRNPLYWEFQVVIGIDRPNQGLHRCRRTYLPHVAWTRLATKEDNFSDCNGSSSDVQKGLHAACMNVRLSFDNTCETQTSKKNSLFRKEKSLALNTIVGVRETDASGSCSPFTPFHKNKASHRRHSLVVERILRSCFIIINNNIQHTRSTIHTHTHLLGLIIFELRRIYDDEKSLSCGPHHSEDSVRSFVSDFT